MKNKISSVRKFLGVKRARLGVVRSCLGWVILLNKSALEIRANTKLGVRVQGGLTSRTAPSFSLIGKVCKFSTLASEKRNKETPALQFHREIEKGKVSRFATSPIINAQNVRSSDIPNERVSDQSSQPDTVPVITPQTSVSHTLTLAQTKTVPLTF